MNARILKYLEDILQAIDAIPLHLKGVTDSKTYSDRKTVRRAVERELEIIGEAMNQLLAEFPEITIPESRKIIAMRNRLIHGYGGIDNLIVWEAATKMASDLRKTIIFLKDKYENGGKN